MGRGRAMLLSRCRAFSATVVVTAGPDLATVLPSLCRVRDAPARPRVLSPAGSIPPDVVEWRRICKNELAGCTAPQTFKDGAAAGDVVQGQLGNCWFISALSGSCTAPRSRGFVWSVRAACHPSLVVFRACVAVMLLLPLLLSVLHPSSAGHGSALRSAHFRL